MQLDESNIDKFTKELRKVAKIDAKIAELKESIKPLKISLKKLETEKKDLERSLCPTMELNNFRQAELPNNLGIIQYTVKQTMVPMTQKTVKERLYLFFKEGPGSKISFNSLNYHEKGEELFEYVYSKHNRQYIKKEELKSRKY